MCTLSRASQWRIISNSILDIIPTNTFPIIVLIDTVRQIKHKDVQSSFSIFFFKFFFSNHPKRDLRSNIKFDKNNPLSRDSRRDRRRRDFEASGKKGQLWKLKGSYWFYTGSSKFLGKDASYLEEKWHLHPQQALKIVQSQSPSQYEEWSLNVQKFKIKDLVDHFKNPNSWHLIICWSLRNWS